MCTHQNISLLQSHILSTLRTTYLVVYTTAAHSLCTRYRVEACHPYGSAPGDTPVRQCRQGSEVHVKVQQRYFCHLVPANAKETKPSRHGHPRNTTHTQTAARTLTHLLPFLPLPAYIARGGVGSGRAQVVRIPSILACYSSYLSAMGHEICALLLPAPRQQRQHEINTAILQTRESSPVTVR